MTYKLTKKDKNIIESNKNLNRDLAIIYSARGLFKAEERKEEYACSRPFSVDKRDSARYVYSNLLLALQYLLIAESDFLIEKYDLYYEVGNWQKIAKEEHANFYKNNTEFDEDVDTL
jgi:hypothetical protein